MLYILSHPMLNIDNKIWQTKSEQTLENDTTVQSSV